jgi:hypothetical protein
MAAIRGVISRNLNIFLILFSSIFVALRVYVRGFMTKAPGLDDAFSVAALVIPQPKYQYKLSTDSPWN